jgi:hypothetical protein
MENQQGYTEKTYGEKTSFDQWPHDKSIHRNPPASKPTALERAELIMWLSGSAPLYLLA